MSSSFGLISTRRPPALQRAMEEGDDMAPYNLAVLMEDTGHIAEAERLFLVSAAAGDGKGLLALGDLLAASGRVEEADAWYRRAVEAGAPDAVETTDSSSMRPAMGGVRATGELGGSAWRS